VLEIDLTGVTQGSIRVFGVAPGASSTPPRVAFMAQDWPLYDGFT
jgi:hypothetical protein